MPEVAGEIRRHVLEAPQSSWTARSGTGNDFGEQKGNMSVENCAGSEPNIVSLERSEGAALPGAAERFVESPKMALQAFDILLDLGEGEVHSFTLSSDTCWWSA